MRKFGALHLIAGINRVLAWVTLVSGLVGSVAIIIITVIGGRITVPFGGRPFSDMASVPGAIAAALILGLLALVHYVLFNAAADVIYLGLAIEENTGATATLLKGEAQLTRVEAPPWPEASF